MTNKPTLIDEIKTTADKHEAVFDAMDKHDYDIDDLAKLLCRVFGRTVRETGADKASIRKVIYGEGSKFIVRVNMLPQESQEGS